MMKMILPFYSGWSQVWRGHCNSEEKKQGEKKPPLRASTARQGLACTARKPRAKRAGRVSRHGRGRGGEHGKPASKQRIATPWPRPSSRHARARARQAGKQAKNRDTVATTKAAAGQQASEESRHRGHDQSRRHAPGAARARPGKTREPRRGGAPHKAPSKFHRAP